MVKGTQEHNLSLISFALHEGLTRSEFNLTEHLWSFKSDLEVENTLVFPGM